MIKNNIEYLNFCIVQKHTINLWKINKMNMEIKFKKKKNLYFMFEFKKQNFVPKGN